MTKQTMKRISTIVIIGCAASVLAQTTPPTQTLPAVETNGIADSFTVTITTPTNELAGFNWYYQQNRKAYKDAVDAWNANTNNTPIVFNPVNQTAFGKLWAVQMWQLTGGHLYRQMLAAEQQEAELQNAWRALRDKWTRNPELRIPILQAAGVATNLSK
jgi:hypothetical protein